MSLLLLAQLISLTANVLTVLIFVWVIASWILVPYHPVREALDRVVEPLLAPIRRMLPMTGLIDFSPMILIILIVLSARILNMVILSLR
ncbi:MAG: YggT family protein [Chloroflexota bacterium]